MRSVLFTLGVLLAANAANARSPIRERATYIQKAKIDVLRNQLVITLKNTDCNNYFGMLLYKGSNRRKDGPHHFDLKIGKTQIDCRTALVLNGTDTKTIRIDLPAIPRDQTVAINAGDQMLVYSTIQPQSSDVAVFTKKEGKPEGPKVDDRKVNPNKEKLQEFQQNHEVQEDAGAAN